MTIEMSGAARVAKRARDLRQPGAHSVRDLLAASSYRAIRLQLDVGAVERAVSSAPELLDDWLGYSGDKRTRAAGRSTVTNNGVGLAGFSSETTATAEDEITTTLPGHARTTSWPSSTIGWRSMSAAAPDDGALIIAPRGLG